MENNITQGEGLRAMIDESNSIPYQNLTSEILEEVIRQWDEASPVTTTTRTFVTHTDSAGMQMFNEALNQAQHIYVSRHYSSGLTLAGQSPYVPIDDNCTTATWDIMDMSKKVFDEGEFELFMTDYQNDETIKYGI